MDTPVGFGDGHTTILSQLKSTFQSALSKSKQLVVDGSIVPGVYTNKDDSAPIDLPGSGIDVAHGGLDVGPEHNVDLQA